MNYLMKFLNKKSILAPRPAIAEARESNDDHAISSEPPYYEQIAVSYSALGLEATTQNMPDGLMQFTSQLIITAYNKHEGSEKMALYIKSELDSKYSVNWTVIIGMGFVYAFIPVINRYAVFTYKKTTFVVFKSA